MVVLKKIQKFSSNFHTSHFSPPHHGEKKNPKRKISFSQFDKFFFFNSFSSVSLLSVQSLLTLSPVSLATPELRGERKKNFLDRKRLSSCLEIIIVMPFCSSDYDSLWNFPHRLLSPFTFFLMKKNQIVRWKGWKCNLRG